ncbi:MAG: aspartate kinase [Thermomicrobiales bacterium]|nr:aspartate kinase [Thermomicrobiales bacterium]
MSQSHDAPALSERAACSLNSIMGTTMRVLKFGGTSVGSAAAISNTADILAAQRAQDERIVGVFSAMSGITNLLLSRADAAAHGDSEGVDAVRADLLAPHYAALFELVEDADRRRQTEALIAHHADEVSRLLYSIYVLRECTARARDRIASFGERMSTLLVAATLEDRGIAAQAIPSDTLIVTDSAFGNASPLLDRTTFRTRSTLEPLFQAGVMPIVTGFFGADEQGLTTTLGRGGSDYSAAILGYALDADEVQIWTDVDGVLTADPRVVPEAQMLDRVSYAEATELAYFGAKVIHPKTMHPAVEKGIPIRIQNTFNPDHVGTLIGADAPGQANGDNGTRRPAKALASVTGFAAVTVFGRGQIGVTDTTSRIFRAVGRTNANVYMISQASSQHSLTFLLEESYVAAIERELRAEFAADLELGRVESIAVDRDLAIVAVIGERMRGTPGVAGRVFSTLGAAGINIIAIAQGSSELNISCAIAGNEATRAVRALHEAFELAR